MLTCKFAAFMWYACQMRGEKYRYYSSIFACFAARLHFTVPNAILKRSNARLGTKQRYVEPAMTDTFLTPSYTGIDPCMLMNHCLVLMQRLVYLSNDGAGNCKMEYTRRRTLAISCLYSNSCYMGRAYLFSFPHCMSVLLYFVVFL